MSETISIGELAAIERTMTPGAWVGGGYVAEIRGDVGHEDGPVHIATLTYEALAVDGAGIVAARNALPVLLELAQAALALAAAQDALVKSWIDPTSSAGAALERDHDACRRARAAYTAALAKVRP